MTAYQQLEAQFRRLGAIEEAVGVLNWDCATMMPPGGAATRAEQLATLSLLAHQQLTAADMGELIDEAEGECRPLDEWQRANLREMRRRRSHATAVPDALVEALSRTASECETVWRKARPANDFAAVLPVLEEMLRLQREVAAAKAERLGASPYEALLDRYEPGGSVATIDRLFAEIAGFLPDLIEAVLTHQAAQPPLAAPPGPFPIMAQRQAAAQLMEALGFDFAHGRLDISAHPFCSGAPDDVRITTRYDESDFTKALMGVLHETGHALYKRNLPARWRLQPVGAARGMAIHESQSLLLEMQVCRSPAFTTFAAPVLRAGFRRRRGRLGAGGAPSPPNSGRPQPDPGRGRRGHLSRPCNPALPSRTGDDRWRPRCRGICPAPGAKACARCSAWRPTTIATGACRTSIGMTARGVISRPIRSAR